MISKADVIAKAMEQGFDDVGFTSAEPFDTHRTFLEQHQNEYGWVEASGLGLLQGTDPKSTLAGAETIVVLMEAYFKMANPTFLEAHFGRCYLDDDRVTKDGLAEAGRTRAPVRRDRAGRGDGGDSSRLITADGVGLGATAFDTPSWRSAAAAG